MAETASTTETDLPSQFRAAMRHLLGGVTLVCTALDGARFGLTATAICSVSAEPPMLLACLNRRGASCDAITRSRVLSVNVLSTTQIELARIFAQQDIAGEERFERGEWLTGQTGAPILLNSLAVFDCSVETMVDGGSHRIFLCRVRDAVLPDETQPPLAYFTGQFVTSAAALVV